MTLSHVAALNRPAYIRAGSFVDVTAYEVDAPIE